MKFTAALAVVAAPLALAKAIHNVYPVERDVSLSPRSPKEKEGKDAQGQQGEQAGVGINAAAALAGSATEVIVIWVNPGNNAATTNLNAQVTVTNTVTVTDPGVAGGAAAATPAAAAATHQVMVGGAAGLQFTPAELTAAVGDMVIFTFMSTNHTATQSAFATPCAPLAGGMDSGFQPNANNTVNPPPQVAMQVMVATPLWFYCAQKGHCGKGMTFSINPTAEKTQAMFQSMAIAQNGSGTPTAITGGSAPAAAAPAAAASSAGKNGTAAAAPAAAAPAAAASGNVQSGTGSVAANGACTCAVTCAVGSFPVNVQGVGMFGGMAGALPATMAEAQK